MGAFWLSAALLWSLGCGGGSGAFPGSAADLDHLGRAVVFALNEGDEAKLASFRLSEAEHNDVIWPELPAARSENPYTLEFAWQNIQRRDRRAVGRLTEDLAPLVPMVYEATECRGETQAFETFQVRTDCYVRFSSSGGLYEVQFFKDVLERGGGHKIFRYYDETPRKIAGMD